MIVYYTQNITPLITRQHYHLRQRSWPRSDFSCASYHIHQSYREINVRFSQRLRRQAVLPRTSDKVPSSLNKTFAVHRRCAFPDVCEANCTAQHDITERCTSVSLCRQRSSRGESKQTPRCRRRRQHGSPSSLTCSVLPSGTVSIPESFASSPCAHGCHVSESDDYTTSISTYSLDYTSIST